MGNWFAAGHDARTLAGVLFAEDFDGPEPATSAPEPEAVAPVVPVFSLAELDAARTEAWQAGHSAGSAEALAGAAGALREAAGTLLRELAALRDGASAEAEQNAERIAGLLLGALAACFPALCARHGEAEAVAVLRAILPGLAQQTAATIRACPATLDALAQSLAQLDPDMAERVRLIPDQLGTPGDVRIAWAGGAVCRDAGSIWRDVVAALEAAGIGLSAAVQPQEVEVA